MAAVKVIANGTKGKFAHSVVNMKYGRERGIECVSFGILRFGFYIELVIIKTHLKSKCGSGGQCGRVSCKVRILGWVNKSDDSRSLNEM
jgi:hypothetical protein